MFSGKIVVAGFIFGLAVASQAQTWDMSGDWTNTGANPNGTWTYGEVVLGGFQKFISVGSDSYGSEYGLQMNTPLIYKPVGLPGVNAGDVDMDANAADPEVIWTAPVNGIFSITAFAGNAVGNTFAPNAVLSVNGIAQSGSYSVLTNIQTWAFTNFLINKGQTVTLEVPDPLKQFPNTDTGLTIMRTAVPEPAPIAVLALGALGLLFRKRK